jgi:uncharacterized protein YcbK (DUF882 family)
MTPAAAAAAAAAMSLATGGAVRSPTARDMDALYEELAAAEERPEASYEHRAALEAAAVAHLEAMVRQLLQHTPDIAADRYLQLLQCVHAVLLLRVTAVVVLVALCCYVGLYLTVVVATLQSSH